VGNMAARITDNHWCPVEDPNPHVGGPIVGGSPDVITGGQSQARVGDAAICIGPLDKIRKGSDTVFVNGKQAARFGDPTDVGLITGGCATVFIGDSGGGAGGSDLADAANSATPTAPIPDQAGGMVGDLSNDNIVTQAPASADASDGAGASGDAAGGQTDAGDAGPHGLSAGEVGVQMGVLPPSTRPLPPSTGP
jgi:uncharacterized Zn-binding protein involved in type VI secretion